MLTCAHCDSEIQGYGHATPEGIVCDYCFSGHFGYCMGCGRLGLYPTELGDSLLCDDCAFYRAQSAFSSEVGAVTIPDLTRKE